VNPTKPFPDASNTLPQLFVSVQASNINPRRIDSREQLILILADIALWYGFIDLTPLISF
jgi:hypothetical protein